MKLLYRGQRGRVHYCGGDYVKGAKDTALGGPEDTTVWGGM